MNMLARTKEAKPLLPEEIRSRLADAGDKMARLVADQMAAAEDITPAGDVKYQAVCTEMKAVAAEVERYELALAGLEKKAAEQLKAEQIREQAGLRQRVAAILDKRAGAAKEFKSALAGMVGAFRMLVELSDQAYCAWPGAQPQGGAALSNAELLELVALELHRQGYRPIPTGGPPATRRPMPNLPGPRCADLMMRDMPEKIVPLSAAIEQANACGRDYLEGRR